MKSARVLIVDDNDVIRRALRGLMRQDESLTVLGEAACGEMALQSIKAEELITGRLADSVEPPEEEKVPA